jgi:hypothetical protein
MKKRPLGERAHRYANSRSLGPAVPYPKLPNGPCGCSICTARRRGYIAGYRAGRRSR